MSEHPHITVVHSEPNSNPHIFDNSNGQNPDVGEQEGVMFKHGHLCFPASMIYLSMSVEMTSTTLYLYPPPGMPGGLHCQLTNVTARSLAQHLIACAEKMENTAAKAALAAIKKAAGK